MDSSQGIYRILVADDDPTIRGVLTAMLSKAGHLVEECGTGHEALKKLALEAYSLLIVDQVMPRMTGSEVIETLRARGEEIPIILASGSLTKEIVGSLEELERVAFLNKPFTFKALAETIGRIAPSVKC